MSKAYHNIRHFIYLNVKAQYRGEGYRLVKKLMEETAEDTKQRVILDERLKDRKLLGNWFADAGVPSFDEGQE